MKRTYALLALILITCCRSFAAIDTVSIYSNSMFKNVKCVVITPSGYKSSGNRYPVVYLLHGFSGSYRDWVTQDHNMQSLADESQVMIVCPDGAYSSWYFDSPIDLTMHYETNVALEIPAYIDSVYRTIKDRRARAISGLSMGGHGALFLAFRHADLFGACGSMSGALDVSVITKNYDVEKRLGDTLANRQLYLDWSVINVIEKYPKDSLAIIMDCGVDDFIIEMSRKTHEKMLRLQIPHDYTERPGKHDWEYWTNSIKYQMLFFKDYFHKGMMQH